MEQVRDMKTTNKNKLTTKNEITHSEKFDIGTVKDRIYELHKEAISHTLYAFERAVDIGKLLILTKENLPHGHYMKWVKENLTFISRATSNRYLAIATNEKILREKLGESLELKKAYNILPKKKPNQKIEKDDKKDIFFKAVADEHIQKRDDDKKEKHIEKLLIKGISIESTDKDFLSSRYTQREKELEEKERQLEEKERLFKERQEKQERLFKERQERLRKKAKELNQKKKLLTVSNLKN